MNSIKNNNNFTLYSKNIIDENEFNELMISNDEDNIFDSFICYIHIGTIRIFNRYRCRDSSNRKHHE